MIIGIDASRANKPNKTGTEWYAYNLINELKAVVPSHVRVRLYTGQTLTGELGNLPANWETKVLYWPLPYAWTTLRLAWEMLIQPPDLLFLPCSGFPAWLPSRVITTIHDIGFDRFPEVYKPIQVWYHRRAVRQAIKKCRLILTISDFTKQELRAVYGQDFAIKVIPLAADARRFAYPIASQVIARQREIYNLPEEYLVYLGRIENKKNVDRLVAAFLVARQTRPNLELVLIGPAGRGIAELQNFFKPGSGIRWLNWLPSQDVPPLLAGAKIFMFPTLYEGFGIPILEAMSVGTPVITSNRGANKEVAEAAALLVEPTSLADMTAAILKLCSDQDLWNNLRAKGLLRSRQFSWSRTAEETWQALEAVGKQE